MTLQHTRVQYPFKFHFNKVMFFLTIEVCDVSLRALKYSYE